MMNMFTIHFIHKKSECFAIPSFGRFTIGQAIADGQ